MTSPPRALPWADISLPLWGGAAEYNLKNAGFSRAVVSRTDAVGCDESFWIGIYRRDAGRGHWLIAGDAVGDGVVEVEELGQEVSLGGESVDADSVASEGGGVISTQALRPLTRSLRFFAAAFQVEFQELGEQLVVREFVRPAVGGEDGFVELAVRNFEPHRTLVVEVCQRSLLELLSAVGVARDETRIADSADALRCARVS